jgi:hypothetical protein
MRQAFARDAARLRLYRREIGLRRGQKADRASGLMTGCARNAAGTLTSWTEIVAVRTGVTILTRSVLRSRSFIRISNIRAYGSAAEPCIELIGKGYHRAARCPCGAADR